MKQQFKQKQIAQICAALTLLNSPLFVFAQNSSNTVIVTGSRFEENLNEVPANVNVITREEIENSSSNTIPQVLSQIGGLRVSGLNSGSLNLDASVDMGGFGPTGNSTTAVLVDGIRINPIDSGNVDWSTIPIDSIERIEILQGGASVQYGNGAVGGVINIITNGGKKNFNQVSASYGTWGTSINNAIFRNTIDKTTLQLSANTSNTNGWRPNTAANAYSIDAKISQDLGSGDRAYVDVYYGYTNQQLASAVVGLVGSGNPLSVSPQNAGNNYSTNNLGFRQGLTKSLNENYVFEIDTSYNNKTSFYYTPQADYFATPDFGYAGGPMNNKLVGWQLALSPRLKANLGVIGTTIIGYDFSKANQGGSNGYSPLSQGIIRANQFDAINNTYGIYYGNLTSDSQSATQINNSFYLIQRIPLSKILEASGGFRRQVQQASTTNTSIYAANGTVNNSQQFAANAGDVALNANYLPGQRVYVKWNQSFRFPNIDEYWGFAYNPDGAYETVFNGILQPQTTQTYEMGGSWSVWKSKITSSIFKSMTQNEISYNPSTGYNYNSIYQTNRGGILFDISSNISPSLFVAAGGKYQKSYYANGPFAGNAIPIVPDTLLNARANYLITSNWSVGGVVNYVSNQHYDTGPNNYSATPTMPAYVIGDIFTSYKFKGIEGRLTVKNVGNAQYSTYGGVSSFSGRHFYYPSEPRSVFASLKYSFN
ncbi:TonB-dependent receptor [Polynucleobacter sp. MWH-Braz-FAM2G]|uniref:TonB-dependent receptor n=1 Tax=Polynucleobacter sp. MWH-Braz-FAM2G TaxID=1855883 RepID=UPI001BFDD835|nr:TonB-dependent receptor [Polynucleobacter sp. MWH-Braz-FAM2G]QWD90146.1 TonB-dependent receptor [Polynucleobacter sp. MWH-Braz-FAM2G]